MKIASPLVLVSALLLSLPPAVGQPSDPKAAPPVPNCANSCTITVWVPAGCGSGIRVSQDPITVPKAPHTTIITFNIGTPGWKFASNGIEILGIDTYARDAFGGKPEVASGNTFRFRHTNRGPATYKYDINLIDPQGNPCKVDPIIVDW